MSESDELMNKADALLERWRRSSVSPRPPADYPLLTEVLQESGHEPSAPPTDEAPAKFKIPSPVDSESENELARPQEYGEERPEEEPAPDSAVTPRTDTAPDRAEAALAEPEAAPAEPETAPAEPEAAPAEPQAALAEHEAALAEPEAALAEPEAALAEPDVGASDPTVEEAPAARTPTADEVEERVYVHLLETIESCLNASIEEPLRTRTEELARDLALSIAADMRNDILTLVRDAVRDVIASEIQSRRMQ